MSFIKASCVSNIDIKFNFDKQSIKVKSKIYDYKKSIQINYSDFDILGIDTLDKSVQNGANTLEFTYKKDIKGLDKEYISLLGDWYPKIKNGCAYKITTSLDKGYKTVYEDTKNEVDKVTFIASQKFVINNKKYNNIDIKTYFLEGNKKLSLVYLDKTIEYIKLYEELIGKFPYEKFRIVENVNTTGYSMPTYTLVGSRILNKPYLVNQSLGHEILHQYFGNSIFSTLHKGNWVEGLTTYLADDYYKKLNGDDIINRKIVLNEYDNYVNLEKDFPISEFNYRFDKSSMLIGYSKLSFVFHMLENKIGSKEFANLIKKLYKEFKFKTLDLKQLIAFFNNNTQMDLSPFFNQWLYKKGIIDFKIENVSNYYNKDGFWMSFDVIQDEKNFYEFDLPITVNTYDEQVNKRIKINSFKQTIKLNFSSEILEIYFDKNIDLFRKLFKKEKLISISALMNDEKIIAVVNKDSLDKYKHIKTIFPNAKIVYSDDLKFKDLKQNTILFLDTNNKHLKHFYPNINIEKNNSFLIVNQHIYNENKRMAVINFGKYKSRYLMMLKHYSKYKEVIFEKDTIIKIMDSSNYGLMFKFNDIPTIQKVQQQQTIKEIYDDIKDKRIVYVGESHKNFMHHLNQLRVIKALNESGKKVSIAMEMFQTAFQKDLDDYLQDKTTLEEFLKRSEYFKRWKIDFNLYKPIIDYAKENRLNIVAINVDRKVTQQISKKGLLSLDEKYREFLPKRIDQSNLAYKKSLDITFKEHIPKVDKKQKHSSPKINLDYFYQSQLVWDEVMAQNIDKFIKDKQDTVLVVIVGSGHLIEHNGIPSRVYNRNSLPYKVILNDYDTTKVGDIVISSKTKTDIQEQHKLGVYLKNSEELIAIRTVKDSFSQKIGIVKGDLIVELNHKKVNDLYDLKRVLYFIDNFKNVAVKVKRDGKVVELEMKN